MSFGGDGGDYGAKRYESNMTRSSGAVDRVAGAAEDFAGDFYRQYIQPQLAKVSAAADTGEARMTEMYDLQERNARLADERYRTKGIPAMDAYYRKAAEYSAPAEEERQAALAIGDVREAQASETGQRDRALTARGINPASPAAIAAANNTALYGTVARAAASTRARQAAKEMGWNISERAAEFGRGELRPIGEFAAGAGNAAAAGLGARTQALTAIGRGADVPMQGYDTAMRGYGATQSAWSSMATQALSAKARSDQAESEGWGQLLGTVAGAGFKYATGGPTAV